MKMSAREVQFQVQIRKTLVFTMRSCFRVVSSHPFLVATLCFLFVMYRSFPLLFSLLLSASPIIVCTASLLGTLLMFGKPEIPEVENNKVDREVSSDGGAVNDSLQRDYSVTENQYELIQTVQDKSIDLEDDISPGEAVDSHMGEHLGEAAHKNEDKNADKEKTEEDSDGDDYDDDDDSSDQDESCSPDASMADIAPMLDELHPLLDMETPLPSHVSHDGSDAGSERSNDKSVVSSDESDEESKEEEEQDRGDDNDDEEEECEAQEVKEDESKKVITWTEDDQKNVMDLGSLELERNQRLETLIARRRARKTLSMMPERNLIDFESADLSFNIPSISTRRQNPFDFPNESYENLGLPPIPGSAPSFLSMRRNPFDIPYDSNEEKPDLKGDGFEEEFFTSPQKETVIFRRHESFNTGPSVLGGSRRERMDSRLRPIFMPEQMPSEGTSYGLFHRQLSEISESKGSSVPDTDSVTSIVEQYDKRHYEQEFYQDADLASDMNFSLHAEHGSQSSENVETLYDEQIDGDTHGEVEITLGGVSNQQEIESNCFEGQDTSIKLSADETLERMEPSEDKKSSRSNTPSLSEGYITGMREGEESMNVDIRSDIVLNSSISTHSSSQVLYSENAVIRVDGCKIYDVKEVEESRRGTDVNEEEEFTSFTDLKEEEKSTSFDHSGNLAGMTSISKLSSSDESYLAVATMLDGGSLNADMKEEGLASVDLIVNDGQETDISKEPSSKDSHCDDGSMLVDDNQNCDLREEEGSTSVTLRGELVQETNISKQHSPEKLYFDDASILVDDQQNSDEDEEKASTNVDPKGDHVQESSALQQHSPEDFYFDNAKMSADDNQNSELKENELSTSVDLVQDTSISEQHSLGKSYFSDTSMVLHDSQHGPVYDTSPPRLARFLPFKSASSDLQAELSEISTPISLDMNVVSSDRGSEVDESVETVPPHKERMSSASSEGYTTDGSSSSSTEASKVTEHGEVDRVSQNLDDQNDSDLKKSAHVVVLSDSTSTSSENGSTEKAEKYEEETQEHVDHDQRQISSLILSAGVTIGTHLDAEKKLESAMDIYEKPAEVNLSQPGGQAELPVEHVEADCLHTVSSAVGVSVETGTLGREKMSSASSQVYTADGNTLSSKASEVTKCDDVDAVDQNLDDQNASGVGNSASGDVLSGPTATSSNESTEKAQRYVEETEEHIDHDQHQVSSSNSSAGVNARVHLNAYKLESTNNSYQEPSEEVYLSQLGDKQANLLVDDVETDCSDIVSSEDVETDCSDIVSSEDVENVATGIPEVGESVEVGTPDKEQMTSSHVYTDDGSSSSSSEQSEVTEHDDVAGVGQNLDDQSGLDTENSAYVVVSPESTRTSSENRSIENAEKYEEETQEHDDHGEGQVSSSNSSAGVSDGVHLNDNKKLESAMDNYQEPSEEVSVSPLGGKQAELPVDHVEADCPNKISPETVSNKKCETNKEAPQNENDEPCISSSLSGEAIQGNMTNEKNRYLHEDSGKSAAPELDVPVRDLSPSALQEQQPSHVDDQEPESNASILLEKKTELTEENSFIGGEVLSSEQCKVHLSSSEDVLSSELGGVHASSSDIPLSSDEENVHVASSDAKTNNDLHQHLDVEGSQSSILQQVLSEENAPSNLENAYSSDKSISKPSQSDQEKSEAL